jgi:protoporphyrinogen/coproporphyrinogen III oxidase
MRVVVVGAGIAGLAAAFRIVQRAPHVDLTVLDQARGAGGKLRTGRLAGGAFETGAEAFLAGDPEGGPSAAVHLADAVGLASAVVQPATARAAIAVVANGHLGPIGRPAFGCKLLPIPAGTVMGIPPDPDPVRDADRGHPLLGPRGDVAVGALVRERRGDEVVDRYVDPLLGGVYAGRADQLSLRMTVPALAAAAESAHTLSEAVRATLAARRAAPGAPVFATVEGGISRLVDALVARLPDVRLGQTVRGLYPTDRGWRLVVGATADPSTVDADAVVLAVPGTPARRLLSDVEGVPVVPLEYASVGLVGLALPLEVPPDAAELSGFLVPATEGFVVKAVTFFDRKWAHWRRDDGLALVRASLGRAGEAGVLQRDDADLIAVVRSELADLLGLDALPPHTDAAVYRWGGGLPQYPPGHAQRVAALRAGLARHPTLAIAGAAYDGVGIPACIRSGTAAADAILDRLEG